MNFSKRFLICAACLLASCAAYAAGPHPTQVDEKSDCLECHADHASGECVHPAVKQGCTSCHSIEERDGESYVSIRQGKGIICFECHQPAELVHAHFPYASGMCLRCHNPHASANGRLLRAKVNELCLQCHLRTPESVPSQYMPTIALSGDRQGGHPYAGHPVSGRADPLAGGEMSCISCHLAHGGTLDHHLKMAASIPEDALNQNTETKDMCRECHSVLWGQNGASGKKGKKKAK